MATTKKTTATSRQGSASGAEAPSRRIDARIAELGDWRGALLARIRATIRQALPDVVEEWKWRGVPVWYRDGMICTGETYKDHVKMTFAKGARLDDPAGLFNSSLDGNLRRAIDFHADDDFDEQALQALVRAAAALNTPSAASGKTPKAAKKAAATKKIGVASAPARAARKPR